MKIEIEITEDDIRSAIERKIRVALADETSGFGVDAYIRERVRLHWKDVADKCIAEACANEPELRAKINAALQAKIQAQLTKTLKASL